MQRGIINTYLPEEVIQYILSIRLSTDGFYFTVYNPIRDTAIHSHRWEIAPELSFMANLRQAYKELDFLSYTYKQVQVMVVTPRFTMLPAEMFDERQTEQLFYYNYQPKENEVILADDLPRNGAVILFALDKSAHQFLKGQYRDVRFYSPVSVLAEQLTARSRLGADNRKMYVCLYPAFVVVYVYERGHLMLLNSFECDNTSDRVYYLLYVWKQLAMDQQHDELLIVSDGDAPVSDREALKTGVGRFVRHAAITGRIGHLIINNE